MIAAAPPQPMTAEEFDNFAELPENDDKILEFIAGEVYEVPSNPRSSEIGFDFGFLVKLHLREKGIAAHVTGEAGGYLVMGERYAPDVAVVMHSKQVALVDHGYNPVAPDLAIEVDFPSTLVSRSKLTVKIANYLMAGTTVWLVLPEIKQIEVYTPGQPVKVLRIGDTLDGGDVLPGFTLKLSEVFGE